MEDLIKNGAFLVDVRTPAEFIEGHVEHSVNIPLDIVLANLDKFKNKEQVIVFCKSGNRSGQAKVLLEQHGITNVTNGGSWQDVKQFIE